MVREAGKGNLRPFNISKNDVKPLLPKYEETLKQLSEIIKVLLIIFLKYHREYLTHPMTKDYNLLLPLLN